MPARNGSPALRLALDQSIVILCPPRDVDEPSQDAVLSGTVELHLPSARSVPVLRVSLVGKADLYLDEWEVEQRKTLTRTVELVHEQTTLVSGLHRFAFSLIIPARTPTTLRSIAGTVNYTVACSAPGLGSNAFGFGTGTLTSSAPVTIVTSPRPLGAPLEPFDVVADGELADAGAYSVAVRSDALAMSSGLDIVVRSVRPMTGVRTLRAKVLERVRIDGSVRERTVQLFALPVHMLDKTASRGLAHSTRWPDCSALSPSTHSGTTDAPIVVEHQLLVELTTSTSSQAVPIARIRGLRLSSCAVRDEFALVPPSYAAANAPMLKRCSRSSDACACDRGAARKSPSSSVDLPRSVFDVKRPSVARFDSSDIL